MTTPILIRILDLQNEQTAMLARMEVKLDVLPELQREVDELKAESRDQKTAIRLLKWAGGFALTVFGLVMTYVSTFTKP